MLVASAGTAPAVAHSLKNLEGQLLKRERYVQIMGKKAPGFTLQDANGERISLSDFSGKVSLLTGPL